MGHSVRKHTSTSSYTGHLEDDVEVGERDNQEGTETPDGPVETSKNEFRTSLQKVFSDADRVERIMGSIESWEDEM